MAQKVERLIEDVKVEQQNLRKKELQLLQEQINPHFLYNTLDTIMWLAIDHQDDKVVEMVAALSGFFRTSLSHGEDKITIREELEHVENYLKIQQLRYGDIMEYSIDVPDEIKKNDIVKISIGDSADVEVDAYNNRKFKGIVTKIASSTSAGSVLSSSNDVTNYEVRIRLLKDSYADLAGNRFPFRPGMNASADIKTTRIDNILSVPITAVNARVKGSDKNMEDKKKEENDKNAANDGVTVDTGGGDELEEVVFILQPDGTVKKGVVTTGIQDINYIEVRSGLKAGDVVVTAPYNAISKKLKDGMQVKVVSKDKLFEK